MFKVTGIKPVNVRLLYVFTYTSTNAGGYTDNSCPKSCLCAKSKLIFNHVVML